MVVPWKTFIILIFWSPQNPIEGFVRDLAEQVVQFISTWIISFGIIANSAVIISLWKRHTVWYYTKHTFKIMTWHNVLQNKLVTEYYSKISGSQTEFDNDVVLYCWDDMHFWWSFTQTVISLIQAVCWDLSIFWRKGHIALSIIRVAGVREIPKLELGFVASKAISH